MATDTTKLKVTANRRANRSRFLPRRPPKYVAHPFAVSCAQVKHRVAVSDAMEAKSGCCGAGTGDGRGASGASGDSSILGSGSLAGESTSGSPPTGAPISSEGGVGSGISGFGDGGLTGSAAGRSTISPSSLSRKSCSDKETSDSRRGLRTEGPTWSLILPPIVVNGWDSGRKREKEQRRKSASNKAVSWID